MVAEAKELSVWHKNIIIKIPCTYEGLKAVGELNKLGIKTNVTLVFLLIKYCFRPRPALLILVRLWGAWMMLGRLDGDDCRVAGNN